MKPITPQSTEKLPKNIIKLLKDIEGWNKGSIKLAHYVQETVRQSMLEARSEERERVYDEVFEYLLKKIKEL
jgi:hypothetical protein